MSDMKDFLKMQDGENFEDYCHRISSMKEELELTWDGIADIINKYTGNSFTESKYRKQERRYVPSSVASTSSDRETRDEKATAEDFTNSYIKDVVTTNFEKNETTSDKIVPLSQAELKDPKALLKAHGFDPEQWEVKTASNTKMHRYSDFSGDSNMYSSRITVKQKNVSELDVIKEVGDYFKTYVSDVSFDRRNFDKVIKDKTLIVPLYDTHYGRIQDGSIGFNAEEQKSRILNHFHKYVSKFEDANLEKVILVVGQDYFNSSFTGYTSSQSHQQSNGLEFKAMYKTGCELMIDLIEDFRTLAPNVEIIGSLGNHSFSEEYAMFQMLEAYYRLDCGISVDSSGDVRKYIKIGNSCIGFGHLDKEGDRAFGLMQTEAPKMWADTRCHIFIAGHLHHFKVESKHSVEIYRVPSICELDKWTVDNGYVENSPKSMAFVFDKEGLSETHFMYE